MFKRILAIILSILTVIGTFCLLGCGGNKETEPTEVELTPEEKIAQAEFLYPDKTEDFRYNRYTNYIKITQCLSQKSNIVIPDTIAGLPVYEIAENAFQDQITISSVSMSNNIITIGENAFAGCTNLEEVKLPSGIKTLGAKAFYKSGLKHIEFPNTLSIIPANVCANCENLSYLIIDEPELPTENDKTNKDTTKNAEKKTNNNTEVAARTLDKGAISNCTELKYIWIPNDVTFADEVLKNVNENITVYGYEKSSAAVVAASSFVDFHLIRSKAELVEFKNKAELASDTITLSNGENYKGAIVDIQIEKTFVVREKVNYLTSYEDKDNKKTIVTNSFEYTPANGTNLVLFGVKITNNSSKPISFNQLNSTIKVDSYTNRFINLGTIKNSALAKYAKPNYKEIQPDETAYMYFAAEVNEDWEEININFGNFSELINYNFVIKNDENIIYVGAEGEKAPDDASQSQVLPIAPDNTTPTETTTTATPEKTTVATTKVK